MNLQDDRTKEASRESGKDERTSKLVPENKTCAKKERKTVVDAAILARKRYN